MPADKRIWGSTYPRPTAWAKVTGTLEYGADLGLRLPQNTLQLALVQAKVNHALIRGIDTSEAEKMPGVCRVLTAKDVKGKNRIFGLVSNPNSKGDGWERPILCDTKVFQYGDAVAIVCADTYAQAQAAAEKVRIDLEELPAYMLQSSRFWHPGTIFSLGIDRDHHQCLLHHLRHGRSSSGAFRSGAAGPALPRRRPAGQGYPWSGRFSRGARPRGSEPRRHPAAHERKRAGGGQGTGRYPINAVCPPPASRS